MCNFDRQELRAILREDFPTAYYTAQWSRINSVDSYSYIHEGHM